MIPQNPLIKEYLDVVLRRKWWIVVPAIIGCLFATALYFYMPKLYKAKTSVKIKEQTISKKVLDPIVEVNATDQISAIRSELTSERYIQALEDELNLVGTPGGPATLEELGAWISSWSDADVKPRQRYFDLTVQWTDPRIAAQVANELAAIYVERNQEIRQQMAEDTVEQLTENRREIEKRLQDVRAEIERFRSENKYELGSFERANLQIIDSNRMEIQEIDGRIRTLQAQNDNIDIQLRIPAEPKPADRDPREADLERLRGERDGLLQDGLLETHPKVQKLQRQIANLEAALGQGAGSIGIAITQEDAESEMLRAQKSRNLTEITRLQGRRGGLAGEIRRIEGRLRLTPEKQIQLENLQMREEMIQAQYDEAARKERTTSFGAMVEEFGQGERFEILRKARMPGKPFWPDLKLFLFMGLSVGLGLGVGLVLLMEVFDQSFKSEEQLAAAVDLPILAVIPDLDKVADRAQRQAVAERRAG